MFHRDIKSENVLVFALDRAMSKIQVKLCDFGISKRFKSSLDSPALASSPPSIKQENVASETQD